MPRLRIHAGVELQSAASSVRLLIIIMHDFQAKEKSFPHLTFNVSLRHIFMRTIATDTRSIDAEKNEKQFRETFVHALCILRGIFMPEKYAKKKKAKCYKDIITNNLLCTGFFLFLSSRQQR